MPAAEILGAGNLRYRLIARSLAAAIGRGTYAVGSKLPTEEELCTRFAASRFTVRQALATLRDQGLIASRRGIGTRVVAAGPRQDYVENFGTVDDVMRQGLGMPLSVGRISDIVADGDLAQQIGCTAGNAFLLIQGFRYAGGKKRGAPLGWSDVYVPAAYGQIRDRLKRLKTTIAQMIVETCGVTIARIDQEIVAVTMPDDLAVPLQVEAGSPALRLTRWYRDADGAVFEIARSLYPAVRYTHRSRIMPARRNG